jgi:hypothetical protein
MHERLNNAQRKEGIGMRRFLAALIVGISMSVLATAAFACNGSYDTNQPQNNAPLVQQPQQPSGPT